MGKKLYAVIMKWKKTSAAVGALAVVLVWFGGHALTSKAAVTKYVTTTFTRGTVITTVTGSGQVQGETQLDITPEVSGKVKTVSVKNGQTVKEGQVLLTLDAHDAQKTVRDASLSLQSAQISLEKAERPADAISLLQAQDAVTDAQTAVDQLSSPLPIDVATAQDAVDSAQRSLEKAQRDLTGAQTQSGATDASAYEDGYGAVSSAFTEFPNIMQDLSDVMGTDAHADENMSYYELKVSSVFTNRLRDDLAKAQTSYAKAFQDYADSSRESDNATKATLITETLAASHDIADSLDDTASMFDQLKNEGYSDLAISSLIDSLIPKISTDVGQAKSINSSLQSAADQVTDVVINGPGNLQNAQDAVISAQAELVQKQTALDTLLHPTADDIRKAEDTLSEKKLALTDLQNGADVLDLKSQQISVAERANALADARETLAKYTIRAPMDGIVENITLKKGQTSSGAIATIVSKRDSAKITLNEIDATKVKVGQKVTLTFDAVDGLTLTGEVADVDGIGTVSQGVVSFGVTIVFDTDNDSIKPGMSVNAAIITAVKQDVLEVPSSAVKTVGGSTFVDIFTPPLADIAGAQGTESKVPPTQKEVTVGLVSDAETEIVSGLSEGDQIVSRTITVSTTKKPSTTPSLLPTGGGGGGGGAGVKRFGG